MLLHWLEEVQLDRVGCFKCEQVKGVQANDLPGAVDPEVMDESWERLMLIKCACMALIVLSVSRAVGASVMAVGTSQHGLSEVSEA